MGLKFLFLFYVLFVRGEAPSIQFRDTVDIDSNKVVYLRDVAEIKHFLGVDQQNVAMTIVALNQEEYARLSPMEVLKKIKPQLAEFEESCNCKIQYTMPHTKQMSGLTQEFSLTILKENLFHKLRQSCEVCTFNITDLQIVRGSIPQQYKKWSMQVNPQEMRGPAFLRVYFDEQTFNPVIVQSLIRIQRPVLALKTALMMGTLLASDVYEERLQDVTHDSSFFISKEDLRGKELKRSLNKGHLLTLADVIERQMVKVGQQVSIEMQKGTFSIEMMGVAQKSGKMGDKIPIKINKTQKQILAEIVSDSRVRL